MLGTMLLHKKEWNRDAGDTVGEASSQDGWREVCLHEMLSVKVAEK